jgi:hypothetical protein
MKAQLLPSKPTSAQQAGLEDQRFSLRNRILAFRSTMYDVFPDARNYAVPDNNSDTPETFHLPIPSTFPRSATMTPLHRRLHDMEIQLRFAEATDALSAVRRSLALLGEMCFM